jgi:hypothetical protein
MVDYPAYPSWRLPYDIDGTRLYSIDAGVSTDRTDDAALINDESTDTTVERDLTWAWVFPSRRVIEYIMVYTDGEGTFQVEASDNSTDGVDGNWSIPWEVISAQGSDPKEAYRTGIRRSPIACKALRISEIGSTDSGTELAMVHLFGDFDYTTDTDSLVFWHPTLDERLPPDYFDFEEVIRGSSEDLTFRIRNTSSTLTATGVSVFLDATTDTTPSVPAQHLISQEETIYRSIENIGDIQPTALSDILTLRRVTARDAILGLWSFRVRATVSSWESATV